ncbi:MAG: FAD-binding domain-containing protein [Quisquiliibacterium sp.]
MVARLITAIALGEQRSSGFEPSQSACDSRIQAIDPAGYAKTRNHLDGRVTRMSPYLTHGFTNVPEVVQRVRSRHRLPLEHKLIYELAWREYFQHLWSRLGDQIFEDLRPPPGREYRPLVPADLRRAATGIPVIDLAVRCLYDTGYLHNHARMWLASYAVHLRRVHWRAGADWMYAHLLDGDLASNHLSWQWVAGTLTGKPYLFDAANVARFAPQWASPNSSIDRSYDELNHLANDCTDLGPDRDDAPGVTEPSLLPSPPNSQTSTQMRLPHGPLTLVHPWALASSGPGCVGLISLDFHARHPWSANRWRFVLDGLRESCEVILVGTSQELSEALTGRILRAGATLNPGYRELLSLTGAQVACVPRLLENPPQPCSSFSKFWKRVGIGRPDDAAVSPLP